MTTIEKVLMNRDGLTEKEAKAVYEDMKSDFNYCLQNEDYCSAEDVMLGCGFEMDYIFDMM